MFLFLHEEYFYQTHPSTLEISNLQSAQLPIHGIFVGCDTEPRLMRNNPIAFRPTDENQKYLKKLKSGKRSKVINRGVDRVRTEPVLTLQDMAKAAKRLSE